MTTYRSAAIAITAISISATAQAVVPENEAQMLGKELTPVGAERAGNQNGSIPAWNGGLTAIPPEFKTGGHYPDPYPTDEPLFTISASNMADYDKHLSVGQKALLKRYPDWAMPVYPTRRSAAFPQGIYDETMQNATKVSLIDGGNGFSGTSGGFPFPIIKNGVEAVWNHVTAYRGDTYQEAWLQAPVSSTGDYTLAKFELKYHVIFGNQQIKPSEREPNMGFYLMQLTSAPPRLAGGVVLVHEFIDQKKQARKAWSYSPGQRRVRLAPTFAYDNPGTAADGLRTMDDFAMFNGATDRYDWKLIGKKEIFIPYNAYELNGDTLKVEDVLLKGHINPQHTRYELHRVWVVEANLKAGQSHIYKTRVFYIDEDSWKILIAEKYDGRGELWRVSEHHTITYYDVPFVQDGVEVHHDLNSGRYLAMRLRMDEDKVYDRQDLSTRDFRPDALRARGM